LENFYKGLTRREFLYIMGALSLSACGDGGSDSSGGGSSAPLTGGDSIIPGVGGDTLDNVNLRHCLM
jgi:hypothetical protein